MSIVVLSVVACLCAWLFVVVGGGGSGGGGYRTDLIS